MSELLSSYGKFEAGVYAFKTIAGENVVAWVEKEDMEDQFYIVKNPVQMMRVSAQQESPMPWVTHGVKDQPFSISEWSLSILPFKPNQDLLNMYNQLFGSGIVTVPASAMPPANGNNPPPRGGGPRLVS